MQKIERETLLNQLESIRPGLATREIIEQSSCFVFKDGKVITYNDEIACTQDSALKLEGAVQAEPLLAMLQKLPGEFVDVFAKENELVIKAGKSRSTGIRMEHTVLLPIETVEVPKKWHPLPEDFGDAITMVSQCASSNNAEFIITCIHLTPNFVEATDNFQLSRYATKLAVKKDCLVRNDSIKHIIDLDMTEFSETQTWVHFKNPTGLILSCRKALDDFPDISSLLEGKGTPTTLPKGLAEATSNALIFTSENADDDSVLINLSPKNGGRLRIQGFGASGWYKETKRLKYTGEPLKFRIGPKLLIELTKRHNECEITADRLLVNSGRFKYASCLEKADD